MLKRRLVSPGLKNYKSSVTTTQDVRSKQQANGGAREYISSREPDPISGHKPGQHLRGPTLLFEKVCAGNKAGRRFYACSACRDRKECNFFQWEDDKVTEARRLAREAENLSKAPPFTQQQYRA
ncbi:hypothetical protein CRUP_004760, partial [Coryphaenoides rupestris]